IYIKSATEATSIFIVRDKPTQKWTESVDFMARSSQFNSDLGGMRIQRQSNGNIDTIFLAAVNGSSATEKMRVAGSGNVTVVGNVCAANISCGSDARLKQNIKPLSYGLSEVLRLRPVKWQWKGTTTRQLNLGLVAQEVEPLMPELILRSVDANGSLGLNYMGLIPVLVKGMQEQQA